MPEQTNSQPYSMDTEVSHSTTIRSYCERFWKMLKLSDRCKKACEDIFLVLATIITLCISAVPTILFFTLEVSVLYAY